MARCKICGKNITMAIIRYYVPDINGKKHYVCKQCCISSHGKALKYDPATDKVVRVEMEDIEIRKKCKNCGHIFCYTPVDLDNNREMASRAKWSALASMGQALGGSITASAMYMNNANNEMARIVDYNKCPKCGSISLRELSKEEFLREKATAKAPATVKAISVADEILKLKQLLDTGIITQEEFEVKKKQLLGL